MCKTQPAGLDVICGLRSELPLSDAGGVCYGQMKMYFDGGMTDYVLFDSWGPCSTGRYVGTQITIVAAGISAGFLKGVRAQLQQRWLLGRGVSVGDSGSEPSIPSFWHMRVGASYRLAVNGV